MKKNTEWAINDYYRNKVGTNPWKISLLQSSVASVFLFLFNATCTYSTSWINFKGTLYTVPVANFWGTRHIRMQVILSNFAVKYVSISWSPFCEICQAARFLRSSRYSTNEHGSVHQTCVSPAYLWPDVRPGASGRGLTGTILTRVCGGPGVLWHSAELVYCVFFSLLGKNGNFIFD